MERPKSGPGVVEGAGVLVDGGSCVVDVVIDVGGCEVLSV